MGHPNLSPSLSRLVENQLMYRNMHPGEEIEIIAIDAATQKPGCCRFRVVSIRQAAEKDGPPDATFEYLGDNFTFFAWEGRGQVTLVSGTLMEAGISARLIPQYIPRMIGLGGICVGRDYYFLHVGGEYRKVAILHDISALCSKYDPNAPFVAPGIDAHIAKIAQTKAADEQKLIDDLPEAIVIPDDHRRRQLAVKLEEYRSRIDIYKAPELQAGTHAKIAVLEQLLEHGTFHPKTARMQFESVYWFTSEAYFTACDVINEYCLNGGEHLHGGTGLPEVP